MNLPSVVDNTVSSLPSIHPLVGVIILNLSLDLLLLLRLSLLLDILVILIDLLDRLLGGASSSVGLPGLPDSSRRLARTGSRSGGLARTGTRSSTIATPAMTDGHLTEALFGTLGILQTDGVGNGIPVGIGLLSHVVEDGLDESELAISEADRGAILVGTLLGRHDD